jgi:hypothetical protein
MKAKNVSVGVQESGGELIVLVRFNIKSAPLEREVAYPEPPKCDPVKYGTRVKTTARFRKEKEIAKLIESLDFPE